MSRLAILYGTSSMAQSVLRNGMLSVLPNHWLLRKSNHCIIMSTGNNDIRFCSNKIIKSTYDPMNQLPKDNLVDYVWKNTTKFDDITVATCGVSGRSYTYGMAKSFYEQMARALLGHCGFKPGEVVALLLPNIPEYIIISYGISLAGLIITFANPLYTADELKRQFENSGVKGIVTISLFLEMALKVGNQLPGYRTTICVGGEDDKIKNIHSLQNLILNNYKADLPEIKPEDLALLPYSSGTTGLPKGVMLTHSNLSSNLAQSEHPEFCTLKAEEQNQKALSVLPFFHIYGFNAIMNSCIKLGISLVTLPKFTPEDYIKALMEHRPYFLFVVPSLLLFLASHPAVTKEHLSSVKIITSGAAAATEGLLQKFREKIGRDILFRQGYGMTELSPVALFTPRSMPSSKMETAGVLLPNTEAKVVSLQDGNLLGPTTPGELHIRGPQVMKGYLNNIEATKEILSEDGWLSTGDVVYYDEDKYFYIIDRCKELIKVKGNQVSPTELENVILEIPEIADVAVVGIPDALAGEIPRAFVVRKKGCKVTEEDVLSYVNTKVTSYKRLAGGVKFLDVIPRNPSGKIIRNELKIIKF